MSRSRAEVGAVAIGGAFGSLARFGIDSLVKSDFPWEIALVNVGGAALMGLLLVRLNVRRRPVLFAAVGPGVLGGFTTFSGLAAFTWDGSWAARVVLLVVTLLAATAAAAWASKLTLRAQTETSSEAVK